MPNEAVPVPLAEDNREPTMLPVDAGQQLINVRSWRGGVQKAGGLRRTGAIAALSAAPRNFFECVFPDGTRQVIALSAGVFQVWNGTAWGSNLSGAAGRAVIPTPSNERFSIVNTLGKVYIAAGGNNDIIVYDPTIAVPPGDLITLTSGLEPTPNNLSCRVILGYGDRLVLVRTMEDNVDQPTTIRWNALDPGPSGGFDTALSGADIRDVGETSSEPLTGGFVIGERGFLTKAHEILELIPTENPQAVFAIESRISGTGLISPYSVAVAQNTAFFVGTDNVYMFDGNQIRAIGDPIIDQLGILFGSPGATQLRPLSAIFPRFGEYHLLPYITGHQGFVYDYLRDRWYERDWRPPDTNEFGPTAIGIISGDLYSGLINPGTQSLIVNGSSTAATTTFVEDEDINARTEYSTTTNQMRCTVQTRQIFPKRRGFRGVVEPAAVDKLNILWEVSFKSAASITVTVTATDANGDTQSQAVTTDAGGRGKAFFNFPWQCVDFTFESTSTSDFQLVGVIGYRWSEGGIHLPTDPA